ncbi:hypothetical protein J6590_105526, partial [Homalodisca vitripennis]
MSKCDGLLENKWQIYETAVRVNGLPAVKLPPGLVTAIDTDRVVATCALDYFGPSTHLSRHPPILRHICLTGVNVYRISGDNFIRIAAIKSEKVIYCRTQSARKRPLRR